MRLHIDYLGSEPNCVPADETLGLLRERILRFAASRLSREAAEDVTQETMLVLHEKYHQVSEPAELLPLAFQIVRFKMSGAARKAVRRGEHTAVPVDELPLPSQGEDPERAAARNELRRQLVGAIGGMGERCRELFRLKLLGKSFDEIRIHFDVDSINTVYTWDSRCRKSLLERLGGRWERSR